MVGNLPEKVQLPALQKGVSLRDVVFTLFRRRWIILAVSLPIIVVGGIGLFRQTGTFTAASRVVVELQKVELPQWNTIQNVDYDRELSTLYNIAMSVPVAEKAAAALADSFEIIKSLDPAFTGGETLADLRDYLADGVDAGPVGESNILEIRFIAIKPRIAMIGARAMRDAFISYHNTGRRNPQAIAFYEDQMKAVRAQIDSLHLARAEVQRAGGYTSFVDEVRHGIGLEADLTSALSRARVDYNALATEYAELVRRLDGDPRDFPVGRDQSAAESMVFLRNLVMKHEDALHSILSVHTPDSVPARRQQALLDQSLARLRVEHAAYIEGIRLQRDSLAGRIFSLEEEIAGLKDKNSGAPEAYGRVSIIDTEIESLRHLLEDLQGKWGEVRMNELADGRVSSVVVLTEPELVSLLSGGKTMVYFVVLAVFALALGIVVGFIVDALDHRIYSPHDVEANLKLPVLASIGDAERV
ncbi:MAG: hypothetical protein IH621_05950 [Krumholzibacteria bacterium]|nr:hypothetical protein [Candidatus Krumholzibacteria bacterium]